MRKSCSHILLIIMLVWGLLLLIAIDSGFAQTSSVPEFTLNYVDNSYDVPPNITTTTNQFTNETTTTTIPSHHIENKTIEVIINNNLNASYYNLRFKGHYEDEWTYYPSNPDSPSGYNYYDAYSVPYSASNTSNTVLSLPLFFMQNIPTGGEVDVQVQALFGNYRAVPYGHITLLPAPTYDFYFEGTTTDWSNTKTITFSESNSQDFISEFPSWTIPIIGQTIVLILSIIFRRRFIREQKNE